MSVRIQIARRLISLGRLVESLALMVMPPKELVEFGRQMYARKKNVAGWASEETMLPGLYPEELVLVEKLPASRGNLLLLDVGGGREAIPLAKMGYQVTGVDYIPEMVAAAKVNAECAGVHIEGLVQEISELDVPPEFFDVVWLSAAMYSCLPTRERRIAFLKLVHRTLKKNGHFLCQFHWGAPEMFSRRAEWARRAFAAITFGNRTYEPGDMLWGNVEFLHSFLSEDELISEFTESGFRLTFINHPESFSRGEAVLLKE